jgi:hypothetical protein
MPRIAILDMLFVLTAVAYYWNIVRFENIVFQIIFIIGCALIPLVSIILTLQELHEEAKCQKD